MQSGTLSCWVFLLLLYGNHSIELSSVRRFQGPAPDQPLEISWGTNESHIEVQLSYPTHGWLAMGLSPDGGMDQSDVLFGYVDDLTLEVIVQDRYLQTNPAQMAVNLSLDAQQDWQKISGYKNGTYTSIRAARWLITCDEADRSFRDVAQYVIYSLHSQPLTSPTSLVPYHTFRGMASINFVAQSKADEGDRQADHETATKLHSEETKKMLFSIGNVVVTNDTDSVSWCALHTVPKLEKKYHAVATQPDIDKQNAENIRQILVYACNDIPQYAPELIKGKFRCNPTDGVSFILKYCPVITVAWVMGQASITSYPRVTGQPWEPEMSGKYLLLQVHYNNPERRSFADDSGIIYHLSEQLQQYDMGTLMAGVTGMDFTMTLPPGQKAFTVQAHCSSFCTHVLPTDGITIFSSVFHMHTRGLSGVIRHFRGSRELPIIDAVSNYDVILQTMRPVTPFRKFLPGDRLVVECNFTTQKDIQPVFGGENFAGETCQAFINYYPKSALQTCGTQFRVPGYLAILSQPRKNRKIFRPKLTPEVASILLIGSSDLPAVRRFMVQQLQPQVQKYFSSHMWNDEDVRLLQEFYTKSGSYLGICDVQGNMTTIPNDNPPAIAQWTPKDSDSCQ
ncbi:DBH-like monooxygenase protein 1 homolog [Paramacrobiotus metropolitanus]|uniref:DBH-like monooxygenase protein 1 homolog n=1 Tax=Paramacrobiotus metropolitanus TaxID=2943436 RepID=UPI0024456894|nr:DBH-like monooxygenase protein 1 homolog [Paramacrobiotus metropolitanus]